MASIIQDLRARLVELRRQKAHALDADSADAIQKLVLVHLAIEALDAVAKEETPKVDPEAMMPKL
jgi:hypothetical protein